MQAGGRRFESDRLQVCVRNLGFEFPDRFWSRRERLLELLGLCLPERPAYRVPERARWGLFGDVCHGESGSGVECRGSRARCASGVRVFPECECLGEFECCGPSDWSRRVDMSCVRALVGVPGDGSLSVEQSKGVRWMPWRQKAMKDVARCEKPRGDASDR